LFFLQPVKQRKNARIKVDNFMIINGFRYCGISYIGLGMGVWHLTL